MQYIDGFRNPEAALAIGRRIDEVAKTLPPRDQPVHIMEVCGTHTMAIARYGIRDVLPGNVDLLSGPGCPVCVTDAGYIDAAIELATRGAIVCTFGDMLNVPGSDTNLAVTRSTGADIRVCYSPADALAVAVENPGAEVVFLGIGFETTIAPVISIAHSARARGIENISVLTAFKLVPPALTALLADPDVEIDAFLCPAHVSAIIGSDAYLPFTGGAQGVPCVVAGFEPLDILYGLLGILEQLAEGRACVDNQYSRVVRPGGNLKAKARIEEFLEPADANWRGIGTIPNSGMVLRADLACFDAASKLGVVVGPGREHPGCLCGDVIKGKCHPDACPMFAGTCQPDHPLGPCMVSSEGTCAAYFKYRRLQADER